MIHIYSSYLSESTQKKENIYDRWTKEKNNWGKNIVSAPLVSAPLVSAPLVSAPCVNRHNKPEIITFKECIVEESY